MTRTFFETNPSCTSFVFDPVAAIEIGPLDTCKAIPDCASKSNDTALAMIYTEKTSKQWNQDTMTDLIIGIGRCTKVEITTSARCALPSFDTEISSVSSQCQAFDCESGGRTSVTNNQRLGR